jgi:DNA topoisomerase-1
MASLLPGMAVADVDLDVAVKLLSLPLSLGEHPQSGEEIQAMNGRFGPYVKCGSESRSIPADISLLNLTREQALELLSQPKTGGRQRAAPAKPLRELGNHPETNKPLVIKSGRYGPYVTDGELNASLARGSDPQALSLQEAVALLAERAARIEQDGGVTKKRAGAKKAAPSGKAATEKKAASKKATTSKTATKKGALPKSDAKAASSGGAKGKRSTKAKEV